ncbi:hypothetical protein BDEG_28522 [Batrachochytrium dendrobatidis JEL423]|uniref:Uncharacterized protein n=1 Tax=Batrachochytrium dendrobatidis (strain JEL423) TaxID=403673 RepID=A0A177WZ60_BATDL|nr:hypothetical protein BDEG_28522 [Batrachochytrium dendrobatidis JEL423]
MQGKQIKQMTGSHAKYPDSAQLHIPGQESIDSIYWVPTHADTNKIEQSSKIEKITCPVQQKSISASVSKATTPRAFHKIYTPTSGNTSSKIHSISKTQSWSQHDSIVVIKPSAAEIHCSKIGRSGIKRCNTETSFISTQSAPSMTVSLPIKAPRPNALYTLTASKNIRYRHRNCISSAPLNSLNLDKTTHAKQIRTSLSKASLKLNKPIKTTLSIQNEHEKIKGKPYFNRSVFEVTLETHESMPLSKVSEADVRNRKKHRTTQSRTADHKQKTSARGSLTRSTIQSRDASFKHVDEKPPMHISDEIATKANHDTHSPGKNHRGSKLNVDSFQAYRYSNGHTKKLRKKQTVASKIETEQMKKDHDSFKFKQVAVVPTHEIAAYPKPLLWIRDRDGKIQTLPLQVAPSAFGESQPNSGSNIAASSKHQTHQRIRHLQSAGKHDVGNGWNSSTIVKRPPKKPIDVIVPLLRSPDTSIDLINTSQDEFTLKSSPSQQKNIFRRQSEVKPNGVCYPDVFALNADPTARPLRSVWTPTEFSSSRRESKVRLLRVSRESDVGMLDSMFDNVPGVSITSGSLDTDMVAAAYKEFKMETKTVLHSQSSDDANDEYSVLSDPTQLIPSLDETSDSEVITTKLPSLTNLQISTIIDPVPTELLLNTSQSKSKHRSNSLHGIVAARRYIHTPVVRAKKILPSQHLRQEFGKGEYMNMHLHPHLMSPPFPIPKRAQILFGPYEDGLSTAEAVFSNRTYYHCPEIYG